MLEKEIEKILVDRIRKMGGRCYKWVSPGNVGVPDRIVILPGRIIFVELKTDTGTQRGVQKVQIQRLRDLGADVRVLKGLSQVEEFLKEVSKP